MAAQGLSTNTFCEAKWIVSPDATQGTHTTVQAAINSASAGDTIFVREGTYTENLTLKAGINIAGFRGTGISGDTTISGNATMTVTGTATIANIRLATNGAAVLTNSGANVCIVNLLNVDIQASNTAIVFSNSNAGSQVNLRTCTLSINAAATAIYSMTATGILTLSYCTASNPGGSTATSDSSAGTVNINYCTLFSPLRTTGSGFINKNYSLIDTSAQNVTSLTINGNVTSNLRFGDNLSGTASAISIGGSSTLFAQNMLVNSSNANAITGTGTLQYSTIVFTGSSAVINPTLSESPAAGLRADATLVSLSDNPQSSTINIGTGSGVGVVKAITLGSTSSTSSTQLNAGSGGVILQAQGAGAVVTNGSSVMLVTQDTAGKVLTSNGAGNAPSFQIPSGIFWTVITANQTAVNNNGYICNKAGTLVLTLPAAAAVGTVIAVTGINTATGWQIALQTGQTVFFGTKATTTTTGTITSTGIRDTLQIVCVVANTSWNVIFSVGNLTIT